MVSPVATPAGRESALPSRAELAMLLSRRFPAGGKPTVAGPLHELRYSTLYRGEGGALPAPVAIKVCHRGDPPVPDPATALAQFEALGRAGVAFAAEPMLAVPAAYAVFPEHATVAVEWVDGKSLAVLLRSPRAPRAKLSGLMELAGRWLAALHGAGPVGTGAVDAFAKHAFLRDESGPRLARDAVFSTALAWLMKRAAAVETISLATSWSHGDFKPDNLLWTGTRLVGLDLHLIGHTVALGDVAAFLAHLALELHQVQILYRRGALGDLRGCFVSGYFGSGEPPHAALRWMELYSLLRGWAASCGSGSPGWQSALRGHLFRSAARGLLRRAEH